MKSKKESSTTKGELLQDKSFGKLELWEVSKETDFFYAIKAYTKDGLQTIVRTETPLRKDMMNCYKIIEAVNERQRLLDSNRELLDAAKQILTSLSDLEMQDTFKASFQKLQSAINNAKNIQP